MKLEINPTTVQFQKNILIHSIASTILETGLNNEELEHNLRVGIEHELYLLSEIFDIAVCDIIPFLMMFESSKTTLNVNGKEVTISAAFEDAMNAYVVRVSYNEDDMRNLCCVKEEICIKCSIINDQLDVSWF